MSDEKNIYMEGPCLILDIMPARVPAKGGDRYFALERYYREPERLAGLYRKMAEILLRLNCYCPMAVSYDCGESWEQDPEPESFVRKMQTLTNNTYFRALFADEKAMIDLDPGDTYMAVYCPASGFLELIRKLAEAEGFFVWDPETGE